MAKHLTISHRPTGVQRPLRRAFAPRAAFRDAATYRQKLQERTVPKAGADSDATAPAIGTTTETPLEPLAQTKQTAQLLDALVDNAVKGPYYAYCHALESNPFVTKACTSFVGFMLGDLIAQHMSHPDAFDAVRMLRLGLYGLLVDGPVGSAWYDFLEARVWPNQPRSTQAVLAKTALDQLVYATIMTGVYFAVIKTLEGHPDAIVATVATKFWPTLAANYMIWPIAHLVNFRFVPADFRILFNNVVCIAWLTWLSIATHSNLGGMALWLLHSK